MLLFAGEHRVTNGWFRVELDINPLYDQREIPRLGPGYQYTPSEHLYGSPKLSLKIGQITDKSTTSYGS